MIDIPNFINVISRKPSSLAEVDWARETCWFDEITIRLLLMDIEDDEIFKLVAKYIVTAWYDLCNECMLGRDSLNSEEASLFFDSSTGDWKFVPVEEDEDNEYILPTIEAFIEEVSKNRNNLLRRKIQKQKLDEKALEKELNQKSVDKCGCIEAMANDNLFSSHYYNEYHRFQDENAQLKAELEKYKSDSEHAINKARIEGIRSVVEQLIIYGEKFPCNQNDKAEVIKEALLAKSFKGHIPSDALTPQWQERLMNLGRKEQGVTFQGESMFNISGNDQVNIGGNNGRK